MINITIQTNADEIAAAMQKDIAGFSRMMLSAMNEAIGELSQETRYPPPPPVPTYNRTYKLQNSLSVGGAMNIKLVQPLGAGALGRFGSRLSYAPYVVDDKRQAWMHQGRWWTLQGKARDYAPKGEKLFEERITEYVKKMVEK